MQSSAKAQERARFHDEGMRLSPPRMLLPQRSGAVNGAGDKYSVSQRLRENLHWESKADLIGIHEQLHLGAEWP